MNRQPISKIDKDGDGSTLLTHSIFYTIQGEGPFVGTPAVFVRLAGCNLKCSGCDTEYTNGAQTLTVTKIITKIWDAFGTKRIASKDRMRALVVITGGEPFRQPIEKLVRALISQNFRVQIETNGTYYRELPWEFQAVGLLTIVCSPKTNQIDSRIVPKLNAIKYVGRAADISAEDGLPICALYHPVREKVTRPKFTHTPIIYLQPMDEKDPKANQRNLEACKEACLKFGYTLCLQTHKIIGVE